MGCPYTEQCDQQDGQCIYFYTYCREYKNFERRNVTTSDSCLSPAQRNFDTHTEKYL